MDISHLNDLMARFDLHYDEQVASNTVLSLMLHAFLFNACPYISNIFSF